HTHTYVFFLVNTFFNNIHKVVDICYFFNDNEVTTSSKHKPHPENDCAGSTKFFITTEATGFRQLYLVTKHPNVSESTVRQITAGDWSIVDRPIFVDTRRELVYF